VVDVDGELQGALGVGDGVHGGIPQHWRDAVSRVGGFAPATDLHVQVEPGGVPLRVGWQTDWTDDVLEEKCRLYKLSLEDALLHFTHSS